MCEVLKAEATQNSYANVIYFRYGRSERLSKKWPVQKGDKGQRYIRQMPIIFDLSSLSHFTRAQVTVD